MASFDFWFLFRRLDTNGNNKLDAGEAPTQEIEKVCSDFVGNAENFGIVSALLCTIALSLPFQSGLAVIFKAAIFLYLLHIVIMTMFLLTFFKHTEGLDRRGCASFASSMLRGRPSF